jgi:hypothetical protein
MFCELNSVGGDNILQLGVGKKIKKLKRTTKLNWTEPKKNKSIKNKFYTIIQFL